MHGGTCLPEEAEKAWARVRTLLKKQTNKQKQKTRKENLLQPIPGYH
jgi:hypothetical protein